MVRPTVCAGRIIPHPLAPSPQFLGEPGAAKLQAVERDALRAVPVASRPMYCANKLMGCAAAPAPKR